MSNKKLPLIALLATVSAAALPLPSQAMHLDNRFEHNQYYHDRGEVVPALPRGAYTVRYRGGDYLYHGGEWYRRNGRVAVVIAAPIGALQNSQNKARITPGTQLCTGEQVTWYTREAIEADPAAAASADRSASHT